MEESCKNLRKICFRIGIIVAVIFCSRILGTSLISFLNDNISMGSGTLQFILQTVLSFVFLYLVPITVTLCLMGFRNRKDIAALYKGGEQTLKAVANTPAIYGMGQVVNIITIAIMALITATTDLNKSFNTVNELMPYDIWSGLILFFQLVVIAPIFEELWFRGFIMTPLMRYGTGFSIFVSAFLFGLTHANFNQFFYAFAVGIGLGYIRYATKSIVSATIIHAIFNSISGFLILFLSTDSVKKFVMNPEYANESIPSGDKIVITAFSAFAILALVFAAIGFIMMVVKIRKIFKYGNFGEKPKLSTGTRLLCFFTSVPLILSLILAFDTFTFRYIIKAATDFFGGLNG